MSYLLNLFKSDDKNKQKNEDKAKDNSGVFLFDSDDESINSDPISQSEPKKKRKTSLLRRIRNAFDRSSIIESDEEEVVTQPTQAALKNPEVDTYSTTQPTQLQKIDKEVVETPNFTQPTQLKKAEEHDEVQPKTQATQLKGIFDDEDDEEVQPKTQATQLKGIFDDDEDDEEVQPKTQATQIKGFRNEEDIIPNAGTQPTQLNNIQQRESTSATQPTQMKAIFDEPVDDDFLDDVEMPPVNKEKSSGLRAIFEESDDSLFDELPEVPGFEKSKIVEEDNNQEQDEEIPAAPKVDEYNSDVSDFEIELESESDKEDVVNLSEDEVEIKEEPKPSKETHFQEYILLSDDEDDDEFDTLKNRNNESAETKATSMVIQAHIARQQSMKNKDSLKKKKQGMDVQDLFAQLRKKAVKQSQKTRVNLEVVEKINLESANEVEDEEIGEDNPSEDDEDVNLDSDYDGDVEPQNSSSDEEVVEQQEDEIFYGKKPTLIESVLIESTVEMAKPPYISDDIDKDENDNLSDFDELEKEKRRLERAKLRREALQQDLNNKSENPFLAEEAEESDSDEDDMPVKVKQKHKEKDEDDEKVDDVLHTSDEEMFDDDSDIDDNEEDLRQLEREQLAKDEEELEKQIQKTLKGERRGIDREDEFLHDENDFEQDDEYIAYKKRQEAMEATVNKRLSKSKKSKINVLEGVNSRITLPENKISVLDKLTVTSTLSFLARDSTTETKEVDEDKSDSDDDDVMRKFKTKIAFSNTTLNEEENVDKDDDDGQADSLMFIKNVKKIVKKPAIESEEMKFRLGVKTYTKNHTKNPYTKTISKGSDKFNFNKDGKREVPFLGKKRKVDPKETGFNYDLKKQKVSQTKFDK